MRIALVEDNKDLGKLISDNLSNNGIRVDIALDGEAALNLIQAEVHDLIILDRGLPDMEGLELLEILREENIKIPVLVLTAKDGLGDKVEGLNSGADDYLVKPFEMEELVARINALYRRPSNVVKTKIEFGNLTYSSVDCVFTIDGKKVDIVGKEKDALEKLIRLPGRVIGKDSLHNIIYGHAEDASDNAIEVIIHRLRKKLADANASIEIKTLRGIGYSVKEKDSVSA